MIRVGFLIYGLTILFLPESITRDEHEDCLTALLESEKLFYNGSAAKFTGQEKLGLVHGNGCQKRCKFIKDHLRSSCNKRDIGCTVGPTNRRTKRSAVQDGCNVTVPQCSLLSTESTYSITGHCNNLNHSDWGMGGTLQKRLLDPVYEDGIGSPKVNGRNGPLPSPRLISNVVHAAEDTTDMDKKYSVFVMLFGQFLAHDITQTPMSKKENGDALECCDSDHDSPACDTIYIPEDDLRFPDKRCMSFPRSESLIDCHGIRQQLNIHSAYIDLSMTYGTTDDMNSELVDSQTGKLRSISDSLSMDPSSSLCELSQPPDPPHTFCPRSGDSRVNESPALASLHVIFHREHNRLVESLATVNPHWSAQELFKQARRIQIAQWQHIVYNEYLPTILGREVMTDYDINVKTDGFKDTYNATVEAVIFNEFSTAAFRFGHSQIPQVLAMLDFNFVKKQSPELLHDHFFNTDLYHAYNKTGLEYLIIGTIGSPCPASDRKFEESIRDNLFHDGTSTPFDLVALNIQRGRDHGLQGYNAYREYCGLARANDFSTNPGGLVDHKHGVATLLGNVFDHPDDIDLFSGLVSERTVGGSLVGPTTQCLIAEQFKRLRDGDSFFYERQVMHGFTEAQLNDIKKIRMSTLICLNTRADKIQDNVFFKATKRGRSGSCKTPTQAFLESCSLHEGIDANLWKDT